MAVSPRGLGKGLDALLNSQTTSLVEPAPNTVPVDDISPNPHQPRQIFPEDSLQELAHSIREQGLLQPILVRPQAASAGKAKYEIIAGERRFRASLLAGLQDIPVIIKHVDDKQSLIFAMIENLQREDLNPIDEAMGLAQLQKKLGVSQEELGRVIGKSRPAISNALRLLQLPEDLQSDVRSGTISAGHARALLALDSVDLQRSTRERIVAEGLSVRQAEALIAKLKDQPPEGQAQQPNITESTNSAAPAGLEEELLAAQQHLESIFGLKVRLQGSKNKGRLVMHFRSNSEFSQLIAKLGIDLGTMA